MLVPVYSRSNIQLATGNTTSVALESLVGSSLPLMDARVTVALLVPPSGTPTATLAVQRSHSYTGQTNALFNQVWTQDLLSAVGLAVGQSVELSLGNLYPSAAGTQTSTTLDIEAGGTGACLVTVIVEGQAETSVSAEELIVNVL